MDHTVNKVIIFVEQKFLSMEISENDAHGLVLLNRIQTTICEFMTHDTLKNVMQSLQWSCYKIEIFDNVNDLHHIRWHTNFT